MDCSHPFKLVSPYKPTGDQPEAIKKVLEGVQQGKQVQVILGATGTGKTFTDANIVATLNRPTLILVHNKTLASQLYGEFKELFPENRVEYFVSNFDFYQPEAYIPKTDTYIDKNAVMNFSVSNSYVYGLERAVKASGNPMASASIRVPATSTL